VLFKIDEDLPPFRRRDDSSSRRIRGLRIFAPTHREAMQASCSCGLMLTELDLCSGSLSKSWPLRILSLSAVAWLLPPLKVENPPRLSRGSSVRSPPSLFSGSALPAHFLARRTFLR